MSKSTWLDRLRVEYSDLVDKIEKLEVYLDATPTEDQVGRELLVVQSSIMDAYKTVLEARVLSAEKEGKL